MRFGLYLATQCPPRSDMVSALDAHLNMVRVARDGGWDGVWGGQHYLSGSVSQLQPVPFLARVAAEAGDMAVGWGIHLLALANPVATAEEVASLDVICRGRLIYGVGLGYREEEYAAFGIPRDDRIRRFEENVALLRRLWAGQEVDADLPWCRLDQQQLTILRPETGIPAIWFAANSDAAVRRAARLGDAWLVNPHARLDTVARQLDLLHEAREEHGRPPIEEIPVCKEVFCAPTREEAFDRCQPYLEAKYRKYARWGQDRALPRDDGFPDAFDELARDRFVVGSPEDCLDGLKRWCEGLGVTWLIIRTYWPGMPAEFALESMELLASEVFPVLRDAASKTSQ